MLQPLERRLRNSVCGQVQCHLVDDAGDFDDHRLVSLVVPTAPAGQHPDEHIKAILKHQHCQALWHGCFIACKDDILEVLRPVDDVDLGAHAFVLVDNAVT